MSTTGTPAPPPGAAATGSSGAGTQINPEAIRFCTDTLQNQTLANAYYNEIATASKNKTYEAEIIDNWLVQQGYKCGVEDVLQAQKQLPTYQFYYWTGGYQTLLGSSKATGPVVTIHAFEQGAQQVGYGDQFLIGPQFNNLVLSWDTAGGLNQNSGSLTFAITAAKDGTATRSFYGTVTDASGTSQPIAGALMTTDQLNQATKSGKAPPAQDTDKINTAATVINFIAQGTFITLNFVMLYKTGKEIAQLKSKLAEKPGDPETSSEMEGAQNAEAGAAKSQDSALNAGEGVQSEFSALPEGVVKDTMSQTIEGNPATPLEGFQNPRPAPTAEEQALEGEVVENADKKAEGEQEDEDEDDEDEGEESETEEGEDLLEEGAESV